MLKRLNELIELFLQQGYKYEDIESTYENYMLNEEKIFEIEKAKVEDLISALESEISYWEE